MANTPFDYNAYRKGQAVVTRDGRGITFLREVFYNDLGDTYLTALIDLKPVLWNLQGKKDFIYGTEDGLDLFMAPPIVYKYVPKDQVLDVDPDDPDNYYTIQIVEPL
ncbi:MAG: hypothetical protein QM791_04165 [Ferruginibacter sp.]